MSKGTIASLFKAALCPASALLILCACESTGAAGPEAGDTKITSKSASEIKPTQYSDEETAQMRKSAEQCLTDILSGMKDRNYKLFIKNFTEETRIDINEKAFLNMVDKFNEKKGPFVAKQYLGDLTQGYFKIFLWKAQFEVPKEILEAAKKAKKKPEDIVKSDTLIRLEMAKIGDSHVVMGIYFQ